MKLFRYLILFSVFIGISCNQETRFISTKRALGMTRHSNNLEILDYGAGLKKVEIRNAWPGAEASHYVLANQFVKVPDSLGKYLLVRTPVNRIVVTSTTSIPFLELLNVENRLIGFPHTDYISSPRTRFRIDKGQVVDLGQNEQLDVEKILVTQPEVIVGFAVTGSTPSLEQVKRAGIPVLLAADWTEQTPLGRAEWIRLFGALFEKDDTAEIIFSDIEERYRVARRKMQNYSNKPKILYGSIYQDQWYLIRDESWMGQLIAQAGGEYLWSHLKGVGSQPISIEKILIQAPKADIWLTTGGASSLSDLAGRSVHYSELLPFKNKKVYTLDSKKGSTGGSIFFETSGAHPDWVLEDLMAIFYPSKFPNHIFHYATHLK